MGIKIVFMARGRPKNIKSWDEREEVHPFVRFPQSGNQAKYLILGSFPPNKFSIYPDQCSKRDERFFYGSKDNSFWDLFIKAQDLDLKWPDNILQLKKWIEINGWQVTDIVAKASRRKNTALDSDLIPLTWNVEVVDSILSENPIEKIVFTSNWVKENFNRNVKSQLLSYNGRYSDIVLISPSPAGLISTDWAKKLLPKIESESLEKYRERYYKWALT